MTVPMCSKSRLLVTKFDIMRRAKINLLADLLTKFKFLVGEINFENFLLQTYVINS